MQKDIIKQSPHSLTSHFHFIPPKECNERKKRSAVKVFKSLVTVARSTVHMHTKKRVAFALAYPRISSQVPEQPHGERTASRGNLEKNSRVRQNKR